MTWLSREWAKRAALPSHVVTMLDNFPTNLHPMSQLSASITALNSESNFARAYSEGINRAKYWEVGAGLPIPGTGSAVIPVAICFWGGRVAVRAV